MHIKTKEVMKSVNQIRFVALVAAAAILLGGCEKESDNTVDNVPVAARITSTIDDMATRAAGTAWAAGDAIGVSTSLMGGVVYTNVKYHTPTAGSGAFTVVNGKGEDNDIYYQDKSDVKFTAYYPFYGSNGTAPGAKGIISKTITDADQTADGQAEFDYLFATATGSVANPTVKFQFRHCMTRIVLNFLPGNGIASLSDLTYTIKALALEGTFNTKTGATAGTATGDLTLSVPYNAAAMSSTLIVFPQQANGANISITMNGVNYTGTIDFPENADNNKQRELRAGYSYTYNVKVNNGTLGIEPADINEWGEGGNTDINTNS